MQSVSVHLQVRDLGTSATIDDTSRSPLHAGEHQMIQSHLKDFVQIRLHALNSELLACEILSHEAGDLSSTLKMQLSHKYVPFCGSEPG